MLFSDREAVNEILTNKSFRKPAEYRAPQNKLYSRYLSSHPLSHGRIQRIIAASFKLSNINQMEQHILRFAVAPLLDMLEIRSQSGLPINLVRVFNGINLDVMGYLCLGLELNGLDTRAQHRVARWVGLSASKPLWEPINRFLRNPAQEKLLSFAIERVKRARDHQLEGTILDCLMNAKDEVSNQRLTDEEVASEALVQL